MASSQAYSPTAQFNLAANAHRQAGVVVQALRA